MAEENQIQELIVQCLKKDTAAFAILVDEYQDLVFRLAFRLLCDENEARDMVQETFIKVWLSLEQYNKKFRFSTWIYKIAANTCYDRLRVLHHSPSTYLSDTSYTDLELESGENIEQTLANKELKKLILRFTEDLAPKQKIVFILRDVEGLDVAEVSIITGLSTGKIKSNLYQARKRIRIKMEQMDIE